MRINNGLPDLTVQIRATLFRIPGLIAQIIASMVRLLLLLTDLAVSLVSVPLLIPLLAVTLLGWVANTLDGVIEPRGRSRQAAPTETPSETGEVLSTFASRPR